MHEAGEAAAQTRATAREEARSILDAAAAEAKSTLARASAEAGRMLVAAQSANSATIAAKRREPVDPEGRRSNVDAMVLLAKAEELMSAAASLPMADAHRVLRERLADRARRMREQTDQ